MNMFSGRSWPCKHNTTHGVDLVLRAEMLAMAAQ
jgi:hypothetical protein